PWARGRASRGRRRPAWPPIPPSTYPPASRAILPEGRLLRCSKSNAKHKKSEGLICCGARQGGAARPHRSCRSADRPYTPRALEVRHVRRTSSRCEWSCPTMSITLPQNYRPTEREPFMNAMQQEYFRQKLLKWKGELIEESNQTLQNMQEESLAQPDLADRATAETDRSLELRTRDRFRKLISKID